MRAKPFFKKRELDRLNSSGIPQHIAIIPDGNRRWAKFNLLQATMGHQKGADRVIDVVLAAKEMGIKAITFYTFSTENWSRSKTEIDFLMNILETLLKNEMQNMVDNDIRLETIGEPSRLPEKVKSALEKTKSATKNGKGIDFILALNYGGKDEIRRAIQKIVQDAIKGQCKPEMINEELISSYLDTAVWPDPDLIIRTGGEMRASNFLLWQGCYSEWVMPNLFWPEFTPQHLLEALIEYQKRERRMGAL